MNRSISEFIDRLRQLQPESAAHPVSDLYDVVELIKNEPEAPQAFPAIFQFFEEHPSADHGSPGPLVHVVEKYRGSYEVLLFESIRRSPMPTTLSMVNRILNSALRADDRNMWLDLLRSAQEDDSVADWIREEAASFIQCQHERG